MHALQIMSSIVAILAFGVSVFVAWTTYGQLKVARESGKIESLFRLLRYLQEAELHKARHAVYNLEGKPCTDWTEEENSAARRVCSSFDFAGLALRHGLVDSNLFFDYWAPALRKLGSVLCPFVVANAYYWRDFYWLIEQANQHRTREAVMPENRQSQGSTPGGPLLRAKSQLQSNLQSNEGSFDERENKVR
jgi:hypothetical protein